MNAKQAKTLKVGQAVTWDAGNAGEPISGKVIETGYAAVKIEYEDGVISTLAFEDARYLNESR